MDYRIKASIQNFFSLLPDPIGHKVYTKIQKKFGSLKQINPKVKFYNGNKIFNILKSINEMPYNKKYLELGTGWTPITPLSLWLLGAKEVVTIDLNNFLNESITRDTLTWIAKNKNIIIKEIETIDKSRFDYLLSIKDLDFNSFINEMKSVGLSYYPGTDAANMKFPDEYFDYYFSYDVLEHIPEEIIIKIFKEGKRILKHTGLFIHRINYADHFAKSDKKISKINFLKFNEFYFKLIASNKYTYMNRLRIDDFYKIYRDLNLKFLYEDCIVDDSILKLIKDIDFKNKINNRFRSKKDKYIATLSSWSVLSKSDL